MDGALRTFIMSYNARIYNPTVVPAAESAPGGVTPLELTPAPPAGMSADPADPKPDPKPQPGGKGKGKKPVRQEGAHDSGVQDCA